MSSAGIDDVLRHARRLVGEKPDPMTDGDLLQRFASTGDPAAFEELLGRHGAMVLRVCRRLLPGREDAEDVFQATFLLLARKASSIRRHASVGPWLYGVALRLARQERAALARRHSHEGRAALRTPDDPLDELSVREARAVLDEELARLPQKYRSPLVLCYLEGKSRDEAAEQLGWSVSLVKSRLEQARDRLRGRLDRRGLSLSGGLLAALLLEDAAGEGTGNPVSKQVAAMVQGWLGTAARSPKGKWLSLVLAGLVAGVGLLAYPAPGNLPSRAKPATVRKAAPPVRGKMDRFGDALPPGALARLGTVRFRPGLPLFQVTFSADGRLLATATQNMEADDNTGALALWDRATGKRLRHFGARKTPYLCLALAPDGKTLATQELTGAVRLWDTATGKEIRQLTGGSVAFNTSDLQLRGVGCLFSPDGKALAARGPDRAIRLWETATGKEVRKLAGAPEDSHPLAFSVVALTGKQAE